MTQGLQQITFNAIFKLAVIFVAGNVVLLIIIHVIFYLVLPGFFFYGMNINLGGVFVREDLSCGGLPMIL